MEKKILRIAVIFVALVVGLSFLFPAEKKLHNLRERSFGALQSTTLFFKNTRAFYYGAEELPEAAFTIYRYGETTQTDTGVYLNFIIVHNWRADEVYIATEPSKAFLALGEQRIFIGDTSYLFNKTAMNNEAQYDFAALVFEALLAEKPITYGSARRNIFGTADNLDANFTVLEDYFRWVYKYR